MLLSLKIETYDPYGCSSQKLRKYSCASLQLHLKVCVFLASFSSSEEYSSEWQGHISILTSMFPKKVKHN